MDTKWKYNKIRFLNKIKYMDYSFCTTDPMALNLDKYKVAFIPNPLLASI